LELKKLAEYIEYPEHIPEWVMDTSKLEQWLSGYELGVFDPENAIINRLDPKQDKEEIFAKISEISAIFIPRGICKIKIEFEYIDNSVEELKKLCHLEQTKRKGKFTINKYEKEIIILGKGSIELKTENSAVTLLAAWKVLNGKTVFVIENKNNYKNRKPCEKWVSTAYSLKIKIFSEGGFDTIPSKLSSISYHAKEDYWCKTVNTSYNILSDNEIELTSLPVFNEKRFLPWELDGVYLNFADLCIDKTDEKVIFYVEKIIETVIKKSNDSIEEFKKKAMLSWEKFRDEFTSDKKRIEKELELCNKGMQLLKQDEDAIWAFKFLNSVMLLKAEREHKFNKWRPFQVIFILISMAKHFYDSEAVSLLNFPTGMGKTEAFMGYALWLAAYERKKSTNFGTTAIIKYPRVMLSKQQAFRAVKLFSYANECLLKTELKKTPFSVGVLYSLKDSPNKIFDPFVHSFSKEFNGFELKLQLDSRRNQVGVGFIEKCPLCDEKLEIKCDKERARILFSCKKSSCIFSSDSWDSVYYREKGELPLFISDEEVFRYRPTMIITTTFKFSTFSNIGHWKTIQNCDGSAINSDSTFGFYYYEKQKTERENFTAKEKLPSWFDGDSVDDLNFKSPSLIVVDETHLISGSHASLLGPVETAFKEIFRTNGKDPQIICSTATVCKAQINENEHTYQHHIAQLFGVKLESVDLFPACLETYRKKDSLIQRKIISFFPSNYEQLYALEKVSSYILSNRTREKNPYYKIPIYYFGSKSEMSIVKDSALQERVSKVIHENDLENNFVEFSGDIEPAQVWKQLTKIEEDVNNQSKHPIILSTNTIANGIDADFFNIMILNGLPNRNDEYVQARSRIARTPNSLGLAILILTRHDQRERSFFENFLESHENKDYLYEENPVNKYSEGILKESIPRLFHLYAFWKHDTAQNPIYLKREMKELTKKCKTELRNECQDVISNWLISPLDRIRVTIKTKEEIAKYIDKYSKLLAERTKPTIYDSPDDKSQYNTCFPSVSLLQVSNYITIKLSKRSVSAIQEIFSRSK